MGEYIPADVTQGVTIPEVDGLHNEWSEPLALPSSMRSPIEVEELLVLTWVLLLYRGSVQSDDGGFSWATSTLQTTSTAETQGGALSDVIKAETDLLYTALEGIRVLRKTSDSDGGTMFFLNAAPSADVSTNSHKTNGCNRELTILVPCIVDLRARNQAVQKPYLSSPNPSFSLSHTTSRPRLARHLCGYPHLPHILGPNSR